MTSSIRGANLDGVKKTTTRNRVELAKMDFLK